AIATMDGSQALQEKLKHLEAEKAQLHNELSLLKVDSAKAPPLPSLEEIKRRAVEVFGGQMPTSAEACRPLQVVVLDLRAFPYQLCDGGDIVWRAHLTLNLLALTAESTVAAPLPGVCRRPLVVDLYDEPQRVRLRKEVSELRAQGLTERDAAS